MPKQSELQRVLAALDTKIQALQDAKAEVLAVQKSQPKRTTKRPVIVAGGAA